MGFLIDLVTLPVLGAPRLVHWLARTIAEGAEREFLDEDRVRGQLLELQERYEAGQISEEEYDRQERDLLEMLKTIRETRERRSREA